LLSGPPQSLSLRISVGIIVLSTRPRT
jgi:hypothetical protein